LEQYRSLDRRIRVVYQANGGQSLALNAAFHKALGHHLSLDADDVFMPDKVRRVVEALVPPGGRTRGYRMLIVDKIGNAGEIPLLSHLATGWQGLH